MGIQSTSQSEAGTRTLILSVFILPERRTKEIRVVLVCYLINKWFAERSDEEKLFLFIDALPEFRNEVPEEVNYWIRWGNLFPRGKK